MTPSGKSWVSPPRAPIELSLRPLDDRWGVRHQGFILDMLADEWCRILDQLEERDLGADLATTSVHHHDN